MRFLLAFITFSCLSFADERLNRQPEELLSLGKVNVTKAELSKLISGRQKAYFKNLSNEEFIKKIKQLSLSLLEQKIVLLLIAEDGYRPDSIDVPAKAVSFPVADLIFSTADKESKVLYHRRMIIRKWLKDKIYPTFEDIELEAEIFYEENPKYFTAPADAMMKQILLNDSVENRKKLLKIEALIKQGVDFDKQIKKDGLISTAATVRENDLEYKFYKNTKAGHCVIDSRLAGKARLSYIVRKNKKKVLPYKEIKDKVVKTLLKFKSVKFMKKMTSDYKRKHELQLNFK